MDVLELALQGWSCKAGAGAESSGAGAGDAGLGLQDWACRAGASVGVGRWGYAEALWFWGWGCKTGLGAARLVLELKGWHLSRGWSNGAGAAGWDCRAGTVGLESCLGLHDWDWY